MISFVEGDMFEAPVDIRVNTVNCVGVMGAGVALAFKERYPEMFRAYAKACKEGRVRPGELEVWRTLTEWIVNFPTKRHWRQKSTYEDVEAGLMRLREYLADKPNVRVALPALGCGHGGLDWKRVSGMIRDYLGDLDAEILVFAPTDSLRAGLAARERRQHLHLQSEVPRVLEQSQPEFPSRLLTLGFSHLSVIGKTELISQDHVAVFNSAKPKESEESAALLSIEALASQGVGISLRFGTRLAHNLAVASAGLGATAILWAAAGLANVRIPRYLRSPIQTGKIAVVSPWAASERWSQQLAARTLAVQATMARAVFVTEPEPTWISEIRHVPVFFIRYGDNGNVVRRLALQGARPIGKDRRTRKPNVTPIVAVVSHG